MLIKIILKDLLDTKAMFYLNDKFRKEMFKNLKDKYKDWRIVAKKIGINPRHLFGLRRGFEVRNNKKSKRFISSREIIKISKLFKINLKKIEKNLKYIRLGRSGRKASINLPKEIDLKIAKIDSVERALAEMIYINKFKSIISFKMDNLPEKKEYFVLNKSHIKRKDNYQDRPIPKKIVFNEEFAKEFGKWIGDRCGGARKVGVSNKNIDFIIDFRNFMIKLNQEKPKINLILKPGFIPNNFIKKHADKISYNKHQYGDYAYRTEVNNRILKEYVFDYFEKNIFSILYYSPKTVRGAFFAGLIEAEGSVSPKEYDITIAFGFKNLDNNEKIIKLLKTTILYKYLLKLDNINAHISRKYCNTKKSSTLKYDIRIKRDSFINFKQKVMPYITHKDKLERLRRLESKLTKKQEEHLVPEISIGLIGH